MPGSFLWDLERNIGILKDLIQVLILRWKLSCVWPKALEERKMRYKFKKLMQSEGTLIPNGYRLATANEIISNIDNFKKWGLPIKTIKCSYDYVKLYRYRNIRLLDGWMSGRFDRDFQLHKAFINDCYWNAVVKEKEWDNNTGKWRTKCSALYSVDGNSLRKKLYDGITLSREGIAVAWVQACFYNDAEVLYWLWQNTDPIESEAYLTKFEGHILTPVMEMVKRLRSCGPRCQLRLENEMEEAEMALEGAIKSLGSYAVDMIELFIEIYGNPFADGKVERISIFIKLLSEFLHKPEDQISIITKLLYLSPHQLGNQIPVFTNLYASLVQELENKIPNIKSPIAEVFIEAIERGYRPLAETLLELKDDISHITTDDCVWALREAVCKGYLKLVKSLLDLLKMRPGLELPVEVDEEGKTLFYYVLPHADVFRLLVTTYGNSITDIIKKQDKFGRNILHWAAKGTYDRQVVDSLLNSYSGDQQLIDSRDDQGKTPLHIAASKGDLQMIKMLLSALQHGRGTSKVKEYVKIAESFGRTALHIAAGKGYVDLVRMLIDKGSDPLKERDVNRKTALHHAAQAKDADAALATCKVLLEEGRTGTSPAKRTLLLWASPAGIGTADEMKDVHRSVKSYLQEERNGVEEHWRVEDVKEYCLKIAAINNNAEIAAELIDRGADLADIQDDKWRRKLNSSDKRSVDNVIKRLKEQRQDNVRSQGHDQPSMVDKLGRHVLAECLAALFLNRYNESPITVGITGDWGMGKSSLMIQTENILLITAAQLAFPNLLPCEIVQTEKISLCSRGHKMFQQIKRGAENRKIYQQIKRGVGKLLYLSKESRKENSLVNMLKEYQPQYHDVYKSLACMNNEHMYNAKSSSQKLKAFRQVSRILTIRYNAWRYSDQYEAWAGLAVTITKEIEKAMTRAQRFSACCRYSWRKHRVSIWIYVLLPCFLTIFLAALVSWLVWKLLKQEKFKGLKYGSIAFTVIAILWVVIKSVLSVVKNVSTQMMGYITSPDHTTRLGYQENVIDDIIFLKKELGEKPLWFFAFILGEWCWNWFDLYSDNVENTSIPKFMPASKDQIRIITFVDDLDRCEEKVILEVLSAIHLVLDECKINVILGMDKKMIERAILRNFDDTCDKDLAEKFICKIIQIPLSLPDPTQHETHSFLEYHLGHKIQSKFAVQDYGEPCIEHLECEEEETDAEIDHRAVHIDDSHNEMQPGCKGIIKKAIDWFGCFLEFAYAISCNISSELRQSYKSNQEKLRTSSSKGILLSRELSLSPNFTAEEAGVFCELANFATGCQKLPREWNRLLHYYRFARNVLSRRRKVSRLLTWEEEFVSWIFVCWQWKPEMNLLIEGWRDYAFENKTGRRPRSRWSGPPLSQIVSNYISAAPVNPQQSMVSRGSSTRERQEDFLKFKGSLRQDSSMKAILSLYKHDSEEGKSQTNWIKLQEVLAIQDVSMKGIQLFQQFRFHCETDHLLWPVVPSTKTTL